MELDIDILYQSFVDKLRKECSLSENFFESEISSFDALIHEFPSFDYNFLSGVSQTFENINENILKLLDVLKVEIENKNHIKILQIILSLEECFILLELINTQTKQPNETALDLIGKWRSLSNNPQELTKPSENSHLPSEVTTTSSVDQMFISVEQAISILKSNLSSIFHYFSNNDQLFRETIEILFRFIPASYLFQHFVKFRHKSLGLSFDGADFSLQNSTGDLEKDLQHFSSLLLRQIPVDLPLIFSSFSSIPVHLIFEKLYFHPYNSLWQLCFVSSPTKIKTLTILLTSAHDFLNSLNLYLNGYHVQKKIISNFSLDMILKLSHESIVSSIKEFISIDLTSHINNELHSTIVTSTPIIGTWYPQVHESELPRSISLSCANFTQSLRLLLPMLTITLHDWNSILKTIFQEIINAIEEYLKLMQDYNKALNKTLCIWINNLIYLKAHVNACESILLTTSSSDLLVLIYQLFHQFDELLNNINQKLFQNLYEHCIYDIFLGLDHRDWLIIKEVPFNVESVSNPLLMLSLYLRNTTKEFIKCLNPVSYHHILSKLVLNIGENIKTRYQSLPCSRCNFSQHSIDILYCAALIRYFFNFFISISISQSILDRNKIYLFQNVLSKINIISIDILIIYTLLNAPTPYIIDFISKYQYSLSDQIMLYNKLEIFFSKECPDIWNIEAYLPSVFNPLVEYDTLGNKISLNTLCLFSIDYSNLFTHFFFPYPPNFIVDVINLRPELRMDDYPQLNDHEQMMAEQLTQELNKFKSLNDI